MCRSAWFEQGINRDGPVEKIRAGDVIHFLPDEKHWHGATATTAMTHVAVYEQLDGKSAEWMEQVSDEQYNAEHVAGANSHHPAASMTG